MGVLAQEIEATYEVLSKMGEGGMGAVYKVRHRFFDEIRVVKVIHGDLELLPELKERFLGEAKRGKQLRHPNLAEVIDFSIASDGTSYMVMEFVDGVNLRQVLASHGGPLDYRFVIPIAEQALAALGFLHSRKFVHRDISPDNIMLIRDGDAEPRVKLIDLGIAKSLESTRQLTMAGKFIGKVQYSSPEQFSGVVDERSDLYALGLVLYELLTNAKPVTGENPMSIIGGHISRPPRAFEETDPSHLVPEPVRQAILKALEKRPEDRHANAAAFAEALRAAVPTSDRRTVEEPIVTRPASALPATGTTEPMTQPMRAEPIAAARPVLDATEVSGALPVAPPRSRRVLPLAALFAVLLVAAILALLWWRSRNAQPTVAPTLTSSVVTTAADSAGPAGTVAPAGQPGRLLINALPWGNVTSVVDREWVEQLAGGAAETPLLLELPAGEYIVSLTNPSSNTSVKLTASLKSGALSRCEAELDRIDAGTYVDRIGQEP